MNFSIGKCTPLGNRAVAIKVIDLNARLDEESNEKKTQETLDQYLQSLKTELKTLRNCEHPNILQFFGVSYDRSGRCLIVTEKLATDLYKLTVKPNAKPSGILPKISFCKDAVDAMTFMHGRNPVYLHLDLKPSNMLVDRNAKVKLCDFGLASAKTPNKPNNSTPTPLGTMSYLPPELLQGSNPTKASDVYSFTISMYEIIFQRTAWSHLENNNSLGIMSAITGGQR